jgi:hypothetical protein
VITANFAKGRECNSGELALAQFKFSHQRQFAAGYSNIDCLRPTKRIELAKMSVDKRSHEMTRKGVLSSAFRKQFRRV